MVHVSGYVDQRYPKLNPNPFLHAPLAKRHDLIESALSPQGPNAQEIWILVVGLVVVLVQVSGKYMIIKYLDPQEWFSVSWYQSLQGNLSILDWEA